ncbi:MAG: hypothetical protein ABJP79_18680 [Tateyamaria sp.]|uniref:hypothetical protein n=1 Tax=Tateyamaria sp. TaxID=1929288 RepID=UPI00329F9F77
MRVDKAARHSAALLVFPVFGVMELAALAGAEVANDLEASLHAVAARIADANALHANLAQMQGGACSGWLRPRN